MHVCNFHLVVETSHPEYPECTNIKESLQKFIHGAPEL